MSKLHCVIQFFLGLNGGLVGLTMTYAINLKGLFQSGSSSKCRG